MNHTTRTRATRPTTPLVLAMLSAALLGALATPARAISPFGSAAIQVKQVFCDMGAIKGDFSAAQTRYSSSGQCVELESPQKPNDRSRNISEFPRVNESVEIFRASWTAQGSYDPVTKETWERLTMPAPNVDQKTPAGRPYGNYETRMICATDPWLTGIGVNCTGKTVNATGNLGDAEALLRQLNRPATTPNKEAQRLALVDARNRYVSMHSSTTASGKGAKVAFLFAPTIIEPRDGSTHPPQTPLRIRVAAATNAKDSAYELEIQVKANFDWRAMTTVPAAAAEVKSVQGYRGWGAHAPGTGPQMMAIAGAYRVRARATAPSRSEPSDWVEFKIDGKPGVTIPDLARSTTVDKVSAAPESAGIAGAGAALRNNPSRGSARPASPTAAGLASPVELLKNKTDAVLLNPQPLPPKSAAAISLNAPASPLAPAKTRADPVLLNPQPLPPSAFPAQAPSALH